MRSVSQGRFPKAAGAYARLRYALLAGTAAAIAIWPGSKPALAACGPGPTTFDCTGTTTDFVGDSGLTVTVQPGATVSNFANTEAIFLRNSNTVVNNGTIIVDDSGTGISVRSFNNVTNNGTISAIAGVSDAWGIEIRRFGNTVTNNGSIVMGDSGIGIQINRFGNNVTNNGTIVAGNDGFGINADRTGNTIVNNGTIRVGDTVFSSYAAGVSLNQFGLGGGNTFTNNGSVIAGVDAFSVISTGGTITNNGVLDGSV